MSRKPTARLDPHAEAIERWLDEEELSLPEVCRRLAVAGCTVTTAGLKAWRAQRQAREFQELMLRQIASGASQCLEVERRLQSHPAPELETLIKLHRVLVLKFSQEANLNPALLALVKDLMKPLIEWARLQEERKKRELAEQKYRDQREADQAAKARKAAGAGEALKPETLNQIEQELKLF